MIYTAMEVPRVEQDQKYLQRLTRTDKNGYLTIKSKTTALFLGHALYLNGQSSGGLDLGQRPRISPSNAQINSSNDFIFFILYCL